MSENNANNHPWVKMNEMTLDGCVNSKADIDLTSSDGLVDDNGSTFNDQNSDETAAPKSNEIPPQLTSEAPVSPHASTDPVVCRCSCTRIQKPGLPDDKHIVQLRQSISDTSNNYGLAYSPDSQVLLSAGSTRSNNPGPLNDYEPWSVPRTFGFESPTDIRQWFREYQSDEDTVSEEGQFGYALTNSDTAGTRERHSSEGEPPNTQDMPATEGAQDMGHRQDGHDLDSDEDS
ncbi:hypothetical protein BDZ45DRAFT_748456 [Acephala macrosclerotiorum]|nr:hypothetical protein BDZ45DRAFT_748456 [Acephala macrosclerotiorum]